MMCLLFRPMGLKKFLNDSNNYHAPIKFTRELDKESFSFVDFKVYLKRDCLTIDLHITPISRHQYVHFTSALPYHTKRSINFSQAFRVRNFSYKIDFRTLQLFHKRKIPTSMWKTWSRGSRQETSLRNEISYRNEED